MVVAFVVVAAAQLKRIKKKKREVVARGRPAAVLFGWPTQREQREREE